MAKFWISKFALTSGIKEVDGSVVSSEPKMIEVPGSFTAYYYGKEWHRTRDEAVLRAEEMRKTKIKSVRSLLSKLENMTF